MPDYEYYTNVYYGSAIGESEWAAVSARAYDYIDYITRGGADDSEAVKKAVCAVADKYYEIESAKAQAMSGALASETVGSWSVTYRTGSEISASYGSELYGIALRYLSNTGLLYRGGRCIVK